MFADVSEEGRFQGTVVLVSPEKRSRSAPDCLGGCTKSFMSSYPRLALAVVLIGVAQPAHGHHSFAAEYDANRPITLNGSIVRVEWTNPHVWIFLDVKERDVHGTLWAVESSTPSTLVRNGLRRELLSPGTTVTVSGYQARSGRPSVRGLSLRTGNGEVLSLGSPAP